METAYIITIPILVSVATLAVTLIRDRRSASQTELDNVRKDLSDARERIAGLEKTLEGCQNERIRLQQQNYDLLVRLAGQGQLKAEQS